MSPRVSLEQAFSDLDAAGERLEQTYYEWAAQLAREAASDALSLLEAELGLRSEAGGPIGSLTQRLQTVEKALDEPASLQEAAVRLDEVLEGTLEPDHEPSVAWQEGGSEEFTTREDAAEAIEAARAIVEACRGALADGPSTGQAHRGGDEERGSQPA